MQKKTWKFRKFETYIRPVWYFSCKLYFEQGETISASASFADEQADVNVVEDVAAGGDCRRRENVDASKHASDVDGNDGNIDAPSDVERPAADDKEKICPANKNHAGTSQVYDGADVAGEGKNVVTSPTALSASSKPSTVAATLDADPSSFLSAINGKKKKILLLQRSFSSSIHLVDNKARLVSFIF